MKIVVITLSFGLLQSAVAMESLNANNQGAIASLEQKMPTQESVARNPFDTTQQIDTTDELTIAGKSSNPYPALHPSLSGGEN